MTEQLPKLETQEISRDKVIGAYKKFVERGIKSPDDLYLDDTEVKSANEIFEAWQAQGGVQAAGNPNAEQRLNFEKTKLYIDAGFTDPSYLEDVLSWLVSDAADVEKNVNNKQSTQLRNDLANEIRKIRSLLQKGAKETG